MVAKPSRYFIDNSQKHWPMCVRIVEGGFTYTMRVKNGQVEEEKVSLGARVQSDVVEGNVTHGMWTAVTEEEAMGHLFPDRPATSMEGAW
jgi:hypothetical protein